MAGDQIGVGLVELGLGGEQFDHGAHAVLVAPLDQALCFPRLLQIGFAGGDLFLGFQGAAPRVGDLVAEAVLGLAQFLLQLGAGRFGAVDAGIGHATVERRPRQHTGHRVGGRVYAQVLVVPVLPQHDVELRLLAGARGPDLGAGRLDLVAQGAQAGMAVAGLATQIGFVTGEQRGRHRRADVERLV